MTQEVRLADCSRVRVVDVFLKLTGASCTRTEDTKEYHPIAPVIVNVSQVGAIYDHTVLVSGQKVVVMESLAEIAEMLNRLRGVSVYGLYSE